MKRILLILTGGTIGSSVTNGIISVDDRSVRVLEMYKKAFPDNDICFTVTELFNILSENLELRHWEKLISYVRSPDTSAYDGIIITHGSDTLSYSSAMLGMCLHGMGVPVILTAADRVPDDKESNALCNFSAAAALACMTSDGVYTVYKNSGDPAPRVFVPTRITEADRFEDRFTELGAMPGAGVTLRSGKASLEGESTIRLLERRRNRLDLSALHFEKRVMMAHPYPSVSFDNTEPAENTGAVLLISYHSGTAPEGAGALINKCRKRNIPVFLCSLKRRNTALYESSGSLLEMGALPLYDIGTESAYAKLLLAVNLCPENISGFMEQDIYYENLT